ncbi:MAG: aspartate-semialdehyde dehydrogenase [Proteobacteria bacterium]|nr:aspartate-semialdehyde dehydrogenase [Pseudomonadota bacterium]
MADRVNLAVAGATGAVGRQMIECLVERDFPVNEVKLLASSRSAGKQLDFGDRKIIVEELTRESFQGVDVAVFSAGAARSLEFAPAAWASGCVVVDNSSAWRMDPDVPLVVPEVNPADIAGYRNKGIIANPNCSTIQMVVALKPLHDEAKIRRVVVSTYQAVSGSGQKAIDELRAQNEDLVAGRRPAPKVYPHQIAANCLPHIDVFLENDYTKEEMKMHHETRKIMGDDSIQVTATAVRVPVYYSHSEAVNIEFERDLSPEKARELLGSAPGIKVVDDPGQNRYPLALDAAHNDVTWVGRIRRDYTVPHGLAMWIVSDNIRKGAATNTVQIAEVLVRDYL